MGESKQCLLAILAASRALACLKQEIACQIVHASGKSAYDNVTVFFPHFLLLAMLKKNLDWTFETFKWVILFEF